MTINNRRRLRARLQRVATALAKRGPAPDPGPITVALARELAAECSRLRDLVDQEGGNNEHWPTYGIPITPDEKAEMGRLHQRIAEKRQLIESSMAGYQCADFRRDHEMLFRWDHRQLKHLSKDEKFQYAARYWCFAVSPEGLGRRRIEYLTGWRKERTPAEQAELDSLQALYPHVPWDDSTKRGRDTLRYERDKAEWDEIERVASLERQKAREARKRAEGNS